MATFLNVLQAFVGFVSALCVMLLRIRFTDRQRKKYSWLRWLDGKQLVLGATALLSLAAVCVIQVAKPFLIDQILIDQTWMVVVEGPAGEPVMLVAPHVLKDEIAQAYGRQADATQRQWAKARSAILESDFQSAIVLLDSALSPVPFPSGLVDLGIAQYSQGDLLAAEDALQQAIDLAQPTGRVGVEAVARDWLGRVLRERGYLAEAVQHHSIAAQQLLSLGDSSGYWLAEVNRAGSLLVTPGREEVEPILRGAIGFGERSSDLRLVAHATSWLGNAYASAGRMDSSRVVLRRAAEMYDALGHPIGAAYARMTLGQVTDGDVGYELLAEAERTFAHTGERRGQVAARIRKLLFLAGKVSPATMRDSLDAIRVSIEELGALRELETLLHWVSWTYVMEGNFGGSAAPIKELIAICTRVGNDVCKVRWSVESVGIDLMSGGSPDSAKVAYLELLPTVRALADTVAMALIVSNLGEVHFKLADLDSALAYYERGRELWAAMGDSLQIAITDVNIGRTHWVAGEADLGITKIRSGIDAIKALDHPSSRYLSVIAAELDSLGIPVQEYVGGRSLN